MELAGITKRYGRRVVLNGVSLSARPGECVAVVGENGCGKSTLLRIAAGLTLPDAGSVIRDAAPQYVPDNFPPIAMSGRQFLKRMARVDCVFDEELIADFHMLNYLDQSIASYSKGMRGKIGALQALLARPKLLLLDEPLSGQDGDSRAAFIAAVKALMAEGCAVLLACHEGDLISALSTRVFELTSGRVEARGCLCAECALYESGACTGRSAANAQGV